MKSLNLKSLLVINDFVAQSFVFKNLLLEEDEEKYKILLKKLKLKKIKNGTSKKNSTLLVTGPGTGLGVCNLKKIDNDVIPIPGEGGNTYFSPSNSEQIEILTHLLKSHKYVSFEDLVSGRGIENLFNFYQSKNRSQILKIKAREIADLADKKNPNAISAITQMYKILVISIINNIFLNGSLGGVIICGGISIKLQKFLNKDIFLDEFLKIDKYFLLNTLLAISLVLTKSFIAYTAIFISLILYMIFFVKIYNFKRLIFIVFFIIIILYLFFKPMQISSYYETRIIDYFNCLIR